MRSDAIDQLISSYLKQPVKVSWESGTADVLRGSFDSPRIELAGLATWCSRRPMPASCPGFRPSSRSKGPRSKSPSARASALIISAPPKGRAPASIIVVSSEVGLTLVPPFPLGRRFQDLLGLVNQRVAAAAGRVYLVVAGVPMAIKSPDKT